MKRINTTFRFSLIALFAVAVSACADNDKAFQQATQQYCELYNPSTWGELAQSGDTYSIYNAIASRQEKEITNEKLKQIIASAETNDFTEYYQSVHSGISKALGSEWQCEYFQQFYMPSQKVVSLSLNGVQTKRINPNDENTIVITVVQSGQILLGSAPLAVSDPKTLTAAIQSRMDGKPIGSMEFVLYFDENSKGDLAPVILGTLSAMGVEQVSLIDF